MLTRLLTAPGRTDAAMVVSLSPDGPYARTLRSAGIEVVELNFHDPVRAARGLVALARLIRRWRPSLVQGWMYYGDLAALLALALSGRRRDTGLIWGIRCSDMDLARYGAALRMVVRSCVALSGRPDIVTANSRAGLEAHLALGYRPRRAELVPNGIDVERFRPDPVARGAVRRALGIAEDAVLLAHVARVDAMKDHPSFLAAMRQLPGVQAMLIGGGTDELPPLPNVHRLGARTDVPALLAASDIVVSSSAFGEGFSNALAEGMACGLPAVATEVGDSAMIVADTGLVVPPRDPAALAAAIRRLADEPPAARAARGARARERIVTDFTLARAQERFASVYAAVEEQVRARGGAGAKAGPQPRASA
jgi:glycosyltransferase involved in cell wall biosynthesis